MSNLLLLLCILLAISRRDRACLAVMAAIVLSLVSKGSSATWYASASGSSTNGTTTNEPWGISYAVTNSTANPHLQPGDTVYLMPGEFVCTQSGLSGNNNGYQLQFLRGGTPSAKITYEALHKWEFVFDGGLYLSSASVSNVVLKFLRIYSSKMANRWNTNNAFYTGGINCTAEGVDILHCLIENTGHAGLGSWSSTKGKNIAGNIIRFVGASDYVNYTPGVGNPTGSGMYLQNDDGSSEALISGNISYYNNTTGMKAFGNNDIFGFNFVGNIIADCLTEAGLFVHQDQSDCLGVTVQSNYLWNSRMAIGYQLGDAQPTNAVIKWNYVTESNTPFAFFDDWRKSTITDNTFINIGYRLVFAYGTTPDNGAWTNEQTMARNRYYGGPSTGYGSQSFQMLGSERTLAQWTNNLGGQDVDSTLTLGTPGTTDVRLMRPSTDSRFTHAAVFNWPTNSTVDVDVSDYVDAGDTLTIYDAQNFPTPFTNFPYAGGSVTLPLNLTNRAAMLGTWTNRADSWQGFDPRFRAFVLFAEAPSGSLVTPITGRSQIWRRR